MVSTEYNFQYSNTRYLLLRILSDSVIVVTTPAPLKQDNHLVFVAAPLFSNSINCNSLLKHPKCSRLCLFCG